MRLDLVTLGDILAQGTTRPEEAFPWYRPDPLDIDRAEITCHNQNDENKFLAKEIDIDEVQIVRRTRLVSASAGTMDKHQEAQNVVQNYLRLMAEEQGRRETLTGKGENYVPKVIPEPPESKSGVLKVILARLVAEGVESWEPAPKAVVPIPSLDLKRGDPLPIPYDHVPPDPDDYSKKANKVLLDLVDALPAQFCQRLALAISWVSNLDVRRFFPDKEEVAEDEAKPAKEREGLEPAPEVGTPQGESSAAP